MLVSREDLTMITGPMLIGGGRFPRFQHCALCGGEGGLDRKGEVVHGKTCVLASKAVTHVRMTGCRSRKRKRKHDENQGTNVDRHWLLCLLRCCWLDVRTALSTKKRPSDTCKSAEIRKFIEDNQGTL